MTLGTVATHQDPWLGEFRLVNHPSGVVWLLNGSFFRKFFGEEDCKSCLSPFSDGLHVRCRQHAQVHCPCAPNA